VKLTDEELMKRFQAGDARAFRELLGRHERRIYNFFLRSFGRKEVAQDLTQDTFLRIIKGKQNYERRAKFTTWMWRIAHNLRVDTYRKDKFRKHDSLDQPIGLDDEKSTKLDMVEDAKDVGAERYVHGDRFIEELKLVLPELDEEQREVFLLRQMEGLSFQEIAEIQDVNINTVKSRMRYALQKLREMLEDFAPGRDKP
jgi:RNA polymerase sigma-70 factor (ECF subfamily)